MPVIELTVVPPSLMASLAMCEWQSMRPGETNLPVTSIDLGVGRDGHVRADRGDLAVAKEDGAVGDRAAGDRQDRAAAERDEAAGRADWPAWPSILVAAIGIRTRSEHSPRNRTAGCRRVTRTSSSESQKRLERL